MTHSKTPIPLLDLPAQYAGIRDDIRAVVDRVMDSQYFILGPEVEAFEQEIAAYSGCEFGIGVSSGTDALLVSMMAIGVRPGHEIILPPYTFFATAGSVARLGAKPVFVDIDPETYNLDARKIEAAVTPRTYAIIPVHLFGQMADMDPILDVARDRDLFVIEDAAQAIGSEYRGRRAGSMGQLGTFSFFPSKNLGGFGDGGMVTTNDSELSMRVRMLRNHGGRNKYANQMVGGNFRLDALQAAVLRVKLKHLDTWTRKRQLNAAAYRTMFEHSGLVRQTADELSRDPGVVLPVETPDCRHIYNQYVIRLFDRDRVKEHLRDQLIASEVYYPIPLHEQECFAHLGHTHGAFPVSEQAAAQTLALPIYPELTETQQERIVMTIIDYYRRPR